MVQTPPFWVFGYGSLIWRPGFEFVSSQSAYLCGYHRSLCVLSHNYRGTPSKPGLVFGLVPGGCCEGRAFEVSEAAWPEVLTYLHQRESDVYHALHNGVRLADGNIVNALIFVADQTHKQYAGRLDLKDQLNLVRTASGNTGSNRDYVVNTVEHLLELGIEDSYLARLAKYLEEEPG
ncbi:MAG: gamma-glutamylcyclotransferase [Devosiaceae bacterium]|nr:gamma-glutamylcyclotransferase [Devosiaceae bacterium]